ncbi:hypothetical protein N665_0763s0018 [Sinapis alba]|nr:hypothetical protein N665_0763s0018 [Sinapis alba]
MSNIPTTSLTDSSLSIFLLTAVDPWPFSISVF